jgi:hypothetical protein
LKNDKTRSFFDAFKQKKERSRGLKNDKTRSFFDAFKQKKERSRGLKNDETRSFFDAFKQKKERSRGLKNDETRASKKESSRGLKDAPSKKASIPPLKRPEVPKEVTLLQLKKLQNFSILPRIPSNMVFSSSNFDEVEFMKHLPITSPKVAALLKNIERLDREDAAREGRLYKHFIFSDVNEGGYGHRVVISALTASGYLNMYSPNYRSILPEREVKQNKTFLFMTLLAVGDREMNKGIKKMAENAFNAQSNSYGEHVRIMVLDAKQKEGIDIKDVKYGHILEPMLPAQEKQAIARGLRFCGQRNLTFEEGKGWTLHVYKYALDIPSRIASKYNIPTEYEKLIEKYRGLDDDDKIMNDFQNCGEWVAIDRVLMLSMLKQIKPKKGGSPKYRVEFTPEPEVIPEAPAVDPYTEYYEHELMAEMPIVQPEDIEKLQAEQVAKGAAKFTPRQIQTALTYRQANLPDVYLESHCPVYAPGAPPKMASLTLNQQFLKSYVTPAMPEKGMLFWHSAGSGKTCTAVAVSNNFEVEGYVILWVTANALTKDVKKNVYLQEICDELNRGNYNDGALPDSYRKSWLGGPTTYRQLTNLLQGMNNHKAIHLKKLREDYESFHPQKRTGASKDRLYKTLLIFDEAQKLFNGELPEVEQPNMAVLQEAIAESYRKSGKDSVRVICLTATPMTSNPFDLFRILNFCRVDQLPVEKKAFMERFKKSDNYEEIRKAIEGYISYVDASSFKTKFAQAKIETVRVKMSDLGDSSNAAHLKHQMDEMKKRFKEKCQGKQDCLKKSLKGSEYLELQQSYETALTAVNDQVSALTSILGTSPVQSGVSGTGSFIPAFTFMGKKLGYKFGMGEFGLGYYLDKAMDKAMDYFKGKPEAPRPASPKPEALKPEASKPEEPRPEEPKPEAPRPEAPRPEAPRPEAPRPEAPRPASPKPEAPKLEAPRPEAPRPASPKPEAPKPDSPGQAELKLKIEHTRKLLDKLTEKLKKGSTRRVQFSTPEETRERIKKARDLLQQLRSKLEPRPSIERKFSRAQELLDHLKAF